MIDNHYWYIKKRAWKNDPDDIVLVATFYDEMPPLMQYCDRLVIKDTLGRTHYIAKFGEFEVSVKRVMWLVKLVMSPEGTIDFEYSHIERKESVS